MKATVTSPSSFHSSPQGEVIRQERAPRLGWRLPIAHHVLRHYRLTHLDSKFQQFAVDPRSAPQRVALRHRANQRPDITRHGRPIGTPPAVPAENSIPL